MYGPALNRSNSVGNRYQTTAKYTDHHIGKVLDFLKTTNNTLVVIVGDHGARKFAPLALVSPPPPVKFSESEKSYGSALRTGWKGEAADTMPNRPDPLMLTVTKPTPPIVGFCAISIAACRVSVGIPV